MKRSGTETLIYQAASEQMFKNDLSSFSSAAYIAQWSEPRPSNPVVVGSGAGGANIYLPAMLRYR